MDPEQLERQDRAHIAVEVLRFVSPSGGRRESRLYWRAIAVLTDYLEPAIPETDVDDEEEDE